MKKISIIFYVVIFFGCTIDEEVPEVEEIAVPWYEDVRGFLKGDLRQPQGVLHKTLYYHNYDNTSLRSFVEHFYDHMDREILRIGLSPELDTNFVSTLKYDAANLNVEIQTYSHPSAVGSAEPTKGRMDKLVWTRTVYQSFDQSNRLSAVEMETHYRERELHRTLSYQNDLLIRTSYFSKENEIAYYQYYYDGDQMVKESYFEPPGETSMRDFFIHYYDNGLMRAKSTELMYSIDEMGDVFVYEYDEHDRLSEEREYGINWGLPLLIRKRYEYF